MFEKFENQMNTKIEQAINEGLDILKKQIDSNTPEDTRKLLGNNEIVKAHLVGDNIVGSVKNETEYGIYVEYGVQGRTYNYHKPKGSVFYTGIGSRFFTRSFDEVKTEIYNNIKKAVGTQ